MDTTVIEEIVNKVNQLDTVDRTELLKRLNRLQPKNGGSKKTSSYAKKGIVSPNTIWMRDHSGPYSGKHVALENGELVATGNGYPDTLANAMKAGAVKPMIGYIPREDEELYVGGW